MTRTATRSKKQPFGSSAMFGKSINITRPQYNALHTWFTDRSSAWKDKAYLSSRELVIDHDHFVKFYQEMEAEAAVLTDKPLRVINSIKNKLKKVWELKEGQKIDSRDNGILVRLTPMQASHLQLASRICTHMNKSLIWGQGSDMFQVLKGNKCAYISIDPCNVEAEAQVIAEALDVLIEYKVSRKPLTELRDELLARRNDAPRPTDNMSRFFDATATLQETRSIDDLTEIVAAPKVVEPHPIDALTETAPEPEVEVEVEPEPEPEVEPEPEPEVEKAQTFYCVTPSSRRLQRLNSCEDTHFEYEVPRGMELVWEKLTGLNVDSSNYVPELTICKAWEIADKMSETNWAEYYREYNDGIVIAGVDADNVGWYAAQKSFEVDFKQCLHSESRSNRLLGGWTLAPSSSNMLTAPESQVSLCADPKLLLDLDHLAAKFFEPNDFFVCFSGQRVYAYHSSTYKMAGFMEALDAFIKKNSRTEIQNTMYAKIQSILAEVPCVSAVTPAHEVEAQARLKAQAEAQETAEPADVVVDPDVANHADAVELGEVLEGDADYDETANYEPLMKSFDRVCAEAEGDDVEEPAWGKSTPVPGSLEALAQEVQRAEAEKEMVDSTLDGYVAGKISESEGRLEYRDISRWVSVEQLYAAHDEQSCIAVNGHQYVNEIDEIKPKTRIIISSEIELDDFITTLRFHKVSQEDIEATKKVIKMKLTFN